ncbi:unnamed protein product [Calicophoron daubneyi]|uniref:Vang-like protein n=1 Tax=Calicophoron daubneyi TaxID=300641 RepID=A0AAV2U086_CALDB
MDVESVRSGRSERSDRSRKSKRVPMSFQGQDAQQKLLQARTNLVNPPCDPALPSVADLSGRSATPSNVSSQAPIIQQRQHAPPYTMYNWLPPPGMPMSPNFSNYPQHTPYSPIGWPTQQMVPLTYPQPLGPPTFPGQPMSLPNQQQPQIPQPMQPVQQHFIPQTAQHPLCPSSLPNTNPPSQINNATVQQPQPTEPYRSEQQFEPHLSTHDDTAWVEDATAVTGATSETGLSGGDNLSRFGARYGLAASLSMQQSGGGCGISGAAAALIRAESDDVNFFSCAHTLGMLASAFVAITALVSPVLMLLIPHFPMAIGWTTEACKPTCEGHLIGISVKMALLSLATWVLSSPCRPFCAGGTAILPRVRLCRTLFLCLVFVVLFSFWLFYTVRVIQPKEAEYLSIVLFADSLTDTLLFLHFAGIGLLELRKIRHRYAIHIVRSPDGLSKTLKCGEMSLQRAALEVLQFYMVEFMAYTPGQSVGGNGGGSKRARRGVCSGDQASGAGGGGSKYKFYDVDSGGSVMDKNGSGAGYTMGQTNNNNGGGAVPSASARLYEELELEKRTRKRRMRLLLAVEEAFTHVRRLATETCVGGSAQAMVPLNPQGNGLAFKNKYNAGKSLDPYEAAQAVFPTLIRPLQKYMRVTRQQARHPVDMVIDHLALCLAYGLSPQAFLERFNPAAATPQLDAAAAASAIMTAKRDKKQQQQQQQQQAQSGQNGPPSNSVNSLLPKHVYPGGQQSWSIVADRALSRSLADGAIFQLRRGSEISLLCTVRRLPLIRLIEEVLEPLEAGRFALNTENAV